ncbi:MAG: hypothetical protein ABIO49_15305 [Dokdonella sp.]
MPVMGGEPASLHELDKSGKSPDDCWKKCGYCGFLGHSPVMGSQVNVRAEKRESGANADIPNCGATLAYFSPGFTLNFNRRFAGFLFAQAPLYQHVNGQQRKPRYSVSAGLHYIF